MKVKARQKASSALEAQVAMLTQQLHESDQSRLQLEEQLDAQHSSSTANAAAAKVGSNPLCCLPSYIHAVACYVTIVVATFVACISICAPLVAHTIVGAALVHTVSALNNRRLKML